MLDNLFSKYLALTFPLHLPPSVAERYLFLCLDFFQLLKGK
jgi:hypothetical protein